MGEVIVVPEIFKQFFIEHPFIVWLFLVIIFFGFLSPFSIIGLRRRKKSLQQLDKRDKDKISIEDMLAHAVEVQEEKRSSSKVAIVTLRILGILLLAQKIAGAGLFVLVNTDAKSRKSLSYGKRLAKFLTHRQDSREKFIAFISGFLSGAVYFATLFILPHVFYKNEGATWAFLIIYLLTSFFAAIVIDKFNEYISHGILTFMALLFIFTYF